MPLSPPAADPFGASHLKIVIRDLVTEARVGLHPWEQFDARPTRLLIDIAMYAPFPRDLGTEHPDTIIDYDVVRDALRDWPTRPHTPLLETLLGEVIGLCFRNPRVAACHVSILKPDIFNDAAGAGVEAFVRREDFAAP